MKAIIGKKIEMTQIFTPDGVVLPVTKIKAEPVTITQIKTKEKDGYEAVQIATGEKRNVNKPLLGHFKGKKYRTSKEFNIAINDVKIGDTWGVNIFEEGEKAKVIGISKGKGFQGVVKRWGFHGSPASHGHKDQLRMPGSIGATGPAHVFKGMRMGGHTGAAQITSKWLEIVKIDLDENMIYVKGSVPGARNGILYIMSEADFKLPVKEEIKEEKIVEEVSQEESNEEVAKIEAKTEVKEEVKEETLQENKKEEKTDGLKEEPKEALKEEVKEDK